MGNTVLYIIEWAFALLLLLAVYKLCFSGTTLHRFNRFYLLGATVLSALLPLMHLTVPETPVVPIQSTTFAQTLTEVTIYDYETDAIQSDAASDSIWAWLLVGCWAVYVIVLLTGWTRSIVKTRRFLKGKTVHKLGHIRVVTHDEQYGPFSWMNCIVISNFEDGFARRASMRHELSHIRLGHYADLVFLLACTIVNPVCWLIMKEIKIVHEYEADDEVINRYGIVEKDYQRLLIMRTVGAEAYALASSFNLNIKQRIIMMKKEKTLKRRMLYLFAVIPVIGIMSLVCGNRATAAEMPELEVFMPDNMPKAGDIISGTVADSDGPIMMVNVTEQDDNGRIFAHSITDLNGDYTFRLAGEGHWLVVSYVGYDEHKEIISSNKMDVKLIRLTNVARIAMGNDGKMSMQLMGTFDAPYIPVGSMKELSDLIKANNTQKCIVSMAPDAPMDALSEIKDVLRKNNCMNIQYEKFPAFQAEAQRIPEGMSKVDIANSLPGAGIDENGNLTINGRSVSKVLVNGKEVPAEEIAAAVVAKSQQSDDDVPGEPFMVVEEMPEFPGGASALLEYIRANMKYPAEARAKNIQGRVVVSFIVKKDGNISGAEITNGVDPELDMEALRLINAMPNWKPGTQRGKAVEVKYVVPINFRLN